MSVIGLIVCLAICLVACATTYAITQDKPNQCFEGSFSPYRIDSEKWEIVAAEPPLFILKNSVKGGHPCAILVLVAPTGQIVRYCYVENGKLRSFYYSPQKDCYVEETLEPELAAEGKKLLQKICKETEC